MKSKRFKLSSRSRLQPLKKRLLEERLEPFARELQNDLLQNLLKRRPDKRNEVQKFLAENVSKRP